MANNYLQYSTQYNFPREVSKEESNKILLKLMEVGSEVYATNSLGSTVEDEFGDTPLDERYVGTSFDIETEGVWFYAEEGGEPDVVVAMIQALQDYFEDDRKHVFSWAYTCSKMRVDEFGGGAAGIVRGKEPLVIDAGFYVSNELDKS